MDINGNPGLAATREYDNTKYLEGIKANIPKDPAEAQAYLLAHLDSTELRRKGSQGSFTKVQQELIAKKEQLDFLQGKVANTRLVLTDSQKVHLEELKETNPSAWRLELNKLEAEAADIQKAELSTALTEVEKEALRKYELANRQSTLEAFSKENPDFDITKPEISEQIPPLYIKQLEQGNLTYAAFLELAKKFVTAPKTISKNVPGAGGTNTTHMGGSGKPIENTVPTNIIAGYEKTIF